jgi:hypothetical protein
MSKIKTIIGISITSSFTVLLGLFYYSLESFFYSDFGCGCSSACRGYYPVLTSKLIGYSLLIGATFLFIASIWKLKEISRFWTIPAILTFIIACYGNGYMIFNKGPCGYSLNKTTFFINQTKLGDYAKTDAETIDMDSLAANKLKGKLLGYSLHGNILKVFRIGAKPITIKTSFLFWKTQNTVILHDISYGLNTFRNFEAEVKQGNYEFIGGQDMTIQDFLDEFKLTQKYFTNKKMTHKKISTKKDGTTRFAFKIE